MRESGRTVYQAYTKGYKSRSVVNKSSCPVLWSIERSHPRGGGGWSPCGPNWISDASLSGPCNPAASGEDGPVCVGGICSAPDGGCFVGGQYFGPEVPMCAQLRVVVTNGSHNNTDRNDCIDLGTGRAIEDRKMAEEQARHATDVAVAVVNVGLGISLLSHTFNPAAQARDLFLAELAVEGFDLRLQSQIANIEKSTQIKIQRIIRDCYDKYPD